MPSIYTESATSIDKVEFNGKIYRRYPDSDRKHLARYFTRSGGRGFLHRDVWEFHHGQIPEGHEIHHKDNNHLNNAVDNLESLSRERHTREHSEQRRAYGRSEKQLQHLESIRHKSKAWHSSPEGRAWHAAHAKQSWAVAKPKQLTCAECGGVFESKLGDAQFCSKRCQNRNWYKRHPEYEAQKRARRKARSVQPERS